MSKILGATAMIISMSTGSALATNYHHFHPWAHTSVGYAAPVSLQHYYAAHHRHARGPNKKGH
jgi:hypothetical protein